MMNKAALTPSALPMIQLPIQRFILPVAMLAMAIVFAGIFLIAQLGVRADIVPQLGGIVGMKLGLGIAMFAICFSWLAHSWRPGAGGETDFVAPLVFVTGLIVLGIFQPRLENGLQAAAGIIILSLPFLIGLTLLTRLYAPTDLCSSSCAIGFCAGGAAAALYALHCPLTDAPTIMLWYGLALGTIALFSRVTLCHFIKW